MNRNSDILDLANNLKTAGETFALATVVRTVAATAAKAGAKAIIRPDGTISQGWIGGGCARSAVLKAAREAMADGKARFVSVQPEDLLAEQGVESGAEKEGVRYARNMCPSKGTMDVFIEPVMPKPELIICGSSPVAVALAELAGRFAFRCIVCTPKAEQKAFGDVDELVDGFLIDTKPGGQQYTVVSTQGRGDEAALRAALAAPSAYVAFVGSKAKAAALRGKLAADGVPPEVLDRLKAPAGLDIGAITPEEIALSIIAEIVKLRRRGQRAETGQSQSPE